MELEDVFTEPVTTTRRRDAMMDVHATGCRDLANHRLYPDVNESAHPAGTSGAAIVEEWFDNGILDEAVADQLYQTGGDAGEIRTSIMREYTHEFSVKPCAARLISKTS